VNKKKRVKSERPLLCRANKKKSSAKLSHSGEKRKQKAAALVNSWKGEMGGLKGRTKKRGKLDRPLSLYSEKENMTQ